jgi:hypothetical protein
MFGLARLISEHPDIDPVYYSTLRSFVSEDGEASAAHVVGGLEAAARCSGRSEPIVRALAAHPSREIRQRAADLNHE